MTRERQHASQGMTSSLGYTNWMREYASRSNEKTLSQQIFVGIIKELHKYQKPVGTHIVDLGCGDGSPVKDFVAFVSDYNPGKIVTYTGIDADAAAIVFAKKKFENIPISKKIKIELNKLDIKYKTIEFTATLQLPTIPEDVWEKIAALCLMKMTKQVLFSVYYPLPYSVH
jgi:SAM-dependent methyltransferase